VSKSKHARASHAYYNQGITYVQDGETDKAITAFTEAIRLNPRLVEAYCNRGVIYGRRGETEKAIADHTKAIRMAPKMAQAYYNRAVAYARQGKTEKAIADYTETIRLNPRLAVVYFNRGIAYGIEGDYNKAIADLTHVIRLDPEKADAYSNRGVFYRKQGETEKAIADYTEAIRLKPTLVSAYFNRRDAYKSLGEYEKANADEAAAIRIVPKMAIEPYCYKQGIAYFAHVGEHDKAINPFEADGLRRIVVSEDRGGLPYNPGIKAEIDANPGLKRMLEEVRDRPCILCGSEPYVNGVYSVPPGHELSQGLLPGKARYCRYSVCERCVSLKGWQERVTARLIESHRAGGFRRMDAVRCDG
jgi:tetratricopeptide (TPR) repeat protein